MKKHISILLLFAMMLSAFAGCSDAPAAEETDTTDPTASAEAVETVET